MLVPCFRAEGAANFWDPFELTPVSYGFWYQACGSEFFPSATTPGTACGICLAPSTLAGTGALNLLFAGAGQGFDTVPSRDVTFMTIF